MGKKREIKPCERFFFVDWVMHVTEEITKEKFYKDVIEDIDSYSIRIEGNHYYFEIIEEYDDENYLDFDQYYDDFRIVYECENPSEDILKEIEKAEQRKKEKLGRSDVGSEI